MLKKPSLHPPVPRRAKTRPFPNCVLSRLDASTYSPCTPGHPNSLRPCWAGLWSILALLAFTTNVSESLFGLSDLRPVSAATIDVYYAPEDLPADHLIALYDHARRYIYVAVYGMTFPPIVKALINAKKRGVDVRVITDRGQGNDPKQQRALEALHLAGIPIRVNQHDGLMHLKQVVIDDEINTTGSMNHTTSGHRYNDERLDVIADRAITVKAREKFLTMWKDPARYEEWKE
jgi:phosphatidylserine/phosphatidylglycerophosphate/cardiolipin synthase-like enzyme